MRIQRESTGRDAPVSAATAVVQEAEALPHAFRTPNLRENPHDESRCGKDGEESTRAHPECHGGNLDVEETERAENEPIE